MTTPTAITDHYTGEERSKRIFAIVGASSGNLVEWFDFYVYAFCAIFLRRPFFRLTTPRCSWSTPLAYSPPGS